MQVWSVNKERVVGIDAVQADSSLSLRLEEGVWWVTAQADSWHPRHGVCSP